MTNTVNLTPIFNKGEAILYACIQLGVKSGRKCHEERENTSQSNGELKLC